MKIAKDHLWPRELEKHGISDKWVQLSDSSFNRLITHYTREAGVRELGRKLAGICLYVGEKIVKQGKDKQTIKIGVDDLHKILGKEPYFLDVAESALPAGVVTGLAWTPMGGDILFIECKAMKGKGKLTITGQLGDVMKESLQIASSHVRSHLDLLNPNFDYENMDIHVHVPAGGIPKDGPSAGITMLAALASLVSNKPICSSIAMSGEITLRGAVLPVGGVKEKLIAAHMAGIKTVILSHKNDKDLEDLPVEVKDGLKIVLVERVEEILSVVMGIDTNAMTEYVIDGSYENHPLHA
jgi:ATP-dependent Lon protease